MNLIGNSCIPAYLYRDWFKVQYNNPFMWNAIDFDSFYYLAKNFDSINFNNFVLDRFSEKPNGNQIIIEGKVQVKYTHYVKDASAEIPTVMGIDVHCKDIESYIVDKYISRLKRMQESKEAPIFLLDASDTSRAIKTYTEDQVNLFAHTKMPNKILLIVPPVCNIKLSPEESKRIKIYRYRSGAKGVNAKTIFLRNVLNDLM